MAGSVPFADSEAAVPPPPDVEAPEHTEQLHVHTAVKHLTVVQRPPRVERPVLTRTILPGYGWLVEALLDKLEQLKRYPRVAKLNRWQGRVVVQASVREDGHIVNPEIKESSGYDVLDQAALETLKATSPLTLKYRLEQPLVAISVPINYQLE